MKKFILLAAVFSPFLGFAQLGVGTTTPTSTLDVRGSISGSFKTFSDASLTLTIFDYTVVYTGSSNTVITLPNASTCLGRVYNIKNNGTGTPQPVVTISAASGQTIDGTSMFLLSAANEAVSLISNGTNWVVGSQNNSGVNNAWNIAGNSLAAQQKLGPVNYYPLNFITDNVERMRLTELGRLGLGSSNPATEMHILSGTASTGIATSYIKGIAITGVGTYGFSGPGFYLENKDNPVGQRLFKINYTANGGTESYVNFQAVSDNAASNVRANILAVTHTGKIGVGSVSFDGSNPEKLLVDYGNTVSKNITGFKSIYDGFVRSYVQNGSAGANANANVQVLNDAGTDLVNNITMGINSSTNSTTTVYGGAGTSYLIGNGSDLVIGNTTSAKEIVFFTGGNTTASAVMRVASTGLNPNTDNNFSLGTSTKKWSVVYAKNGTIQTSDARLKTNIKTLPYGLKEVLLLRPVSFQWKTEPKSKKVGLIAQDVQKIVPEVVIGNATKETLGMNYAELVPVLIKAIQEQQAQIDALKKEINSIKKQ